MNKYDIYKENSQDGYCCTIEAKTERRALKEYQKKLMSSGYSWIRKGDDGKLTLETSYGACFAAYPSNKD